MRSRTSFSSTERSAFGWVALLLAATGSVLGTTRAAGQESPTVAVDSRVRITAPSLALNEAFGTVRSMSPQELLVQFDAAPDPQVVVRSAITEMLVRTGSNDWEIGLGVIGAVAGGAVGALLGAAEMKPCGGAYSLCAEGVKPVLGGLFGAGIFWAAGVAIGRSISRETWSPVPWSGAPVVVSRAARARVRPYRSTDTAAGAAP